MSIEEAQKMVIAYLKDVSENVQFSACQALDIRFGTKLSSLSVTISLTDDGKEFTGSAGSIGSKVFANSSTIFTSQTVDENALCVIYETTEKEIHFVITFRYKRGQIDVAQGEFHQAIAIFNARHNPTYK